MLRNLGFVLLTLAVPDMARAFNCARVNTSGNGEGASLAWFGRTIPYTLSADGTADIPGDAERQVLRDSFAVWATLEVGGGAASCGLPSGVDFTFVETPASSIDRVGYDFLQPEVSENLLVFRDSGWNSAENNVIALTTTTYDAVTGEILDADIEFNSTIFDFTITDTNIGMDLQNTAVHEIGHFLGLAHTQPSFQHATMAARAIPGETEKRDLACDDALGITFKYPAAEPNGYCDPPVQDCGNCAPPDTVIADTHAVVTKQSASGDLHSGCAAVEPGFVALMATGLVLSRRRRSAATV